MKQLLKIAIMATALLMGLQLSAQEQKQQRQRGERPTPTQVVEKLDANDDGKISKEEAAAAPRGRFAEHFDQIDADSDGFVTAAELEAFRGARKGRKKGEKPQGC